MLWKIFSAFCNFFSSAVKNQSTEAEIKRWLATNQPNHVLTRIDDVELHAIQPPGWLQVYRFSAILVTDEGERQQLFGVIKSDDRLHEPIIQVFESWDERETILGDWSSSMIVKRSSRFR